MAKVSYDSTQQRILIAIGLLERVTIDEPLDVQVNIIKAFCNSTIKGTNAQAKRDDLLSAVNKLEYIAGNLNTAADFLKAAIGEIAKTNTPAS